MHLEPYVLIKEKEGWLAFSLTHKGIHTEGKTAFEAKDKFKELFFDLLTHEEIEDFQKLQDNIDPFKFVKEMYGKDYDKEVLMVMLAELDLKDYLNITDASKSERTNVSIKKGYKVIAKMRGINISDFLNKALSKELNVKY